MKTRLRNKIFTSLKHWSLSSASTIPTTTLTYPQNSPTNDANHNLPTEDTEANYTRPTYLHVTVNQLTHGRLRCHLTQATYPLMPIISSLLLSHAAFPPFSLAPHGTRTCCFNFTRFQPAPSSHLPTSHFSPPLGSCCTPSLLFHGAIWTSLNLNFVCGYCKDCFGLPPCSVVSLHTCEATSW